MQRGSLIASIVQTIGYAVESLFYQSMQAVSRPLLDAQNVPLKSEIISSLLKCTVTFYTLLFIYMSYGAALIAQCISPLVIYACIGSGSACVLQFVILCACEFV